METPLRHVVVICATVVLVVGIIVGALWSQHIRYIDNQKSMMTACTASGGTWVENAAHDFECRK